MINLDQLLEERAELIRVLKQEANPGPCITNRLREIDAQLSALGIAVD